MHESRTKEIERAMFIAGATTLEGDDRVLLMGAMRSCRVLARYVEELEQQNDMLREIYHDARS